MRSPDELSDIRERFEQSPGCYNLLRYLTGKTRRQSVNRSSSKYSTLPKFCFGVCIAHPGSSLRGDRTSSVSRAGLRWTRQRRARKVKGRAGSPCEPATACRRAALMRTAKPCGPGRRCYGQAFAEVCASPTGRTAPSIRGAREARRKVRLPGEHGISRPTIAQGRPSDWRHLYAAVRFFCATSSRSGPRVPVGTRSSLRPLGLERVE